MIDDLDLRDDTSRTPPAPEGLHETPAPPRGPSLILPLALVAAAAGAGLYFFVFRNPGTPAAPKTVAETSVEVGTTEGGPRVPPLDGITVPPLDETDGLVRQLVAALSSRPEIAAWLATDGLVRNFVVVTDNIAEGKTPVQHLKRLAPNGPFAAGGPPQRIVIHPASYQRYDGIGDAVSGLDATSAARIYATFNRRIDEAYRDLGHPDGQFDKALARAMTRLLSVPAIDGDITLEPHIESYRYADERLESLSAAEKQLLRMGPRNIRLIQAKMREGAKALGLPVR
jgi:hypothetical protein